MKNNVEGIVERYAPSLLGHGDHGFYLLLTGGKNLFYFAGSRTAYAALHDRSSEANAIFAELIAVGDHISFDVDGDPKKLAFTAKVEKGSLRNWTLEGRLFGTTKDITPTQADFKQVGNQPILITQQNRD
jgi:hypothetical protein